MASFEINWVRGSEPQHLWLDERTEVIVFEEAGQIRAFNSICPHMGAALEIRNDKLFCPWHGLAYSLKDGTSDHHKYRRACEYKTHWHEGKLTLSRSQG